MCPTSSRTDCYPQQVNVMETPLWWENAHIVLMLILEYSHVNLLPNGCKLTVASVAHLKREKIYSQISVSETIFGSSGNVHVLNY